MTKNLVFSFIIPAHNEEKVIGDCLNSINVQKKISENYEIIVVNDGSTDKTSEIARKRGVIVIDFEKGHSAAFARNKGSERATGKYLIFLDADQVIEKNFMEKLNKLAKKDFSTAAIRILSRPPKTIFQKGWHAYREYNRCAAMIIKRKVFNEIKFREDLFYVEDDVLFEETKKRGYNLEESGALVYHIDPETFGDYLRQRKWQGRGIVIKIFLLKKYWAIRYFVPCLILPLMTLWKPILLVYLLLTWIFFSLKSKETVNSFFWIVTDFIGRFISLFWFVVYALASGIKGRVI